MLPIKHQSHSQQVTIIKVYSFIPAVSRSWTKIAYRLLLLHGPMQDVESQYSTQENPY